ncbi:MAG: MarR family transcriptional regulator [Haloarculaceae archaeon]
MNRRQADLAVALAVVAVLAVGGALAWRAGQRRPDSGHMMGSMMGSSGGAGGPDPLWYVLGTVLVAGTVAASYLAVRPGMDDGTDRPAPGPASDSATGAGPESRSGVATDDDSDAEPTADGDSSPDAGPTAEGGPSPDAERRRPRPQVLDVLPDDERRVLEPVVDSPGITQIELRDRSEFSKSKVSQTVSELEKRGLLYREPQGRTYRVYPSDDLDES